MKIPKTTKIIIVVLINLETRFASVLTKALIKKIIEATPKTKNTKYFIILKFSLFIFYFK